MPLEFRSPTYGLRATVSHNQGGYSALIADTIARYRSGQPILYYTWTPYWVSNELVQAKDGVWPEVPFSSLPGEQKGMDTHGKNYGFTVNYQHILVNKAWCEKT